MKTRAARNSGLCFYTNLFHAPTDPLANRNKLTTPPLTINSDSHEQYPNNTRTIPELKGREFNGNYYPKIKNVRQQPRKKSARFYYQLLCSNCRAKGPEAVSKSGHNRARIL